MVPGRSASGADQNWLPAGPSDIWNLTTALNWDAGAAWVQNNDAIFGGTADTISVTVPITFNNMTFNSTGYVISSTGAGSLTLGNDFSSTITVTNADDTAALNETLANNGTTASSLIKDGVGTLTLTGTANNTYSGGTSIAPGTLSVGHVGGLGTGGVTNNATLNLTAGAGIYTGLSTSLSGAGTVNVTLSTGTGTTNLDGNYSGFTGTWNVGIVAAAGAGKVSMGGLDNASATINVLTHSTVFVSTATTHNASIVLNGGDTGESLGQLRIEGGAIWAGPVTLAGAITGTGDSFIGANSGTGTISGAIGETGGAQTLSKGGAGTTVLSGTNTYTGGTEILNGAISVANLANALGSTSGITFGVSASATTGTLTYTGTGETFSKSLAVNGNASLINNASAGTLNYTGTLTNTNGTAAVANLNLQGTGAAGIVSSVISDNTTAFKTAVLKNAGAGIWTLAGVNTYTGGTTVSAGTLAVSGAGTLGGTTGALRGQYRWHTRPRRHYADRRRDDSRRRRHPKWHAQCCVICLHRRHDFGQSRQRHRFHPDLGQHDALRHKLDQRHDDQRRKPDLRQHRRFRRRHHHHQREWRACRLRRRPRCRDGSARAGLLPHRPAPSRSRTIPQRTSTSPASIRSA